MRDKIRILEGVWDDTGPDSGGDSDGDDEGHAEGRRSGPQPQAADGGSSPLEGTRPKGVGHGEVGKYGGGGAETAVAGPVAGPEQSDEDEDADDDTWGAAFDEGEKEEDSGVADPGGSRAEEAPSRRKAGGDKPGTGDERDHGLDTWLISYNARLKKELDRLRVRATQAEDR